MDKATLRKKIYWEIDELPALQSALPGTNMMKFMALSISVIKSLPLKIRILYQERNYGFTLLQLPC